MPSYVRCVVVVDTLSQRLPSVAAGLSEEVVTVG